MKKLTLTLLIIVCALQTTNALEPVKTIKLNSSPGKARFSSDFKTLMIISDRKVTFYNTDDWTIKDSLIIEDSVLSKNRPNGSVYHSVRFDVSSDGKILLVHKSESESHFDSDDLFHYSLPDYQLIFKKEYINYSFYNGVRSWFGGIMFGDRYVIISYDESWLDTYYEKRKGGSMLYDIESHSFFEWYSNSIIAGSIYNPVVLTSSYESSRNMRDGTSWQTNTYCLKNILNSNTIFCKEFNYTLPISKSIIDKNNNIISFFDDYTLIYNDTFDLKEKIFINESKNFYNDVENLKSFLLLEDEKIYIAREKNKLIFFRSPDRLIIDEYVNNTEIKSMYYLPLNNSIIIIDSDSLKMFSGLEEFNILSSNFCSDKDTVYTNQEINFFPHYTDSSSIYLWDFGDGNFSNEIAPVHIYKNSGTYSINLKVSNDSLESETEKTDYITVLPSKLDSNSNFKLLFLRTFDNQLPFNNIQYSRDGNTIALTSNKEAFTVESNNGETVYSKRYFYDDNTILFDRDNQVSLCFREETGSRLSLDIFNFISQKQIYKSQYFNMRTNCPPYSGADYYESFSFYISPDNLTYSILNRQRHTYSDRYYSCEDETYNYLIFTMGDTVINLDAYFDNWLYNFEFSGKYFNSYNGQIFYISDNTYTRINSLNYYTGEIIDFKNKVIFDKNKLFEFYNEQNDMLSIADSTLYHYKSNSDTALPIKKFDMQIIDFKKVPNLNIVIFITDNKELYVFNYDSKLVMGRINFDYDLVNLAISPKQNEFAVLDAEGNLYAFNTTLLPVSDIDNRSKSEEDLFIYPNPAMDYIEINSVILSEAKDPVVLVYNVLGGKLMDSRLRGNDIIVFDESKVRIDISSLNPGVYFVRIGNKVQKFVKM